MRGRVVKSRLPTLPVTHPQQRNAPWLVFGLSRSTWLVVIVLCSFAVMLLQQALGTLQTQNSELERRLSPDMQHSDVHMEAAQQMNEELQNQLEQTRLRLEKARQAASVAELERSVAANSISAPGGSMHLPRSANTSHPAVITLCTS